MAEVKMVLVPGHKPIRILKWLVKKGDWIKHGTSLAIYRPVEDPSKQIKTKEIYLKSKHVGTLKMFLLQEGQVAIPGGILLEIDGCCHPVVMKDLCAECGQDLRTLDHPLYKKKPGEQSASVSMIPSIPELRISAEQAEEIAEQDKNRLLRMRKLVLLVDLDQTLIHTTQDPGLAALCQSDEDFYSFQLSKNDPMLYTKLRPHCRDFLKEVSKCYELQIVTFGSRQYAHKIADFVDSEKKYFAHRILSRDECIHPFKKSGNLKHLFPCGDSMVCIIDDRDDVWNAVPNLIVVKKYTYFQGTEDINNPFHRKTKNDVNRNPLEMKSMNVSPNRRKRDCDIAKPGNDQENVKRCRIETVETEMKIKSGTDGMEKCEVVPTDCNINETVLSADANECSEKIGENVMKKRGSVDEDLSLSSDSDSESNASTTSSSSSNSKSSNLSSNSETSTQKNDVKKTEEVSDEISNGLKLENKINGDKAVADECDSKLDKSAMKPDLSTKGCNESAAMNNNNNNKIEKMKKILSATDEVCETIDKNKDVISAIDSEKNSSQDTCPVSSQSSLSEQFTSSDPLKPEISGFSFENNEFATYSEASSQESLNNFTWKYKDTDDYLPYLQDILLQIHSTYYEAYDKFIKKEFKELPDVRGVVPFLRSKVLYGCCLVLTGVIPHNFRFPPHQHKAYIIARQLGAEIHDQITDRTTHLIAAKKGTAKYQEVKKRETQDIKLVSSEWLWCCSERWERVPEELFHVPDKIVSESSDREVTPPVPTQRIEQRAQDSTNTYDPSTGKLTKKVKDARFNFMMEEEKKRKQARSRNIVYSSLTIPDAVISVVPINTSDVSFKHPETEKYMGKHEKLTKRNTTPGASTGKKRCRKRSMVEILGIEYSLSTDDIASMDKEVDDLLESSDEEEDEKLGTLIGNQSSPQECSQEVPNDKQQDEYDDEERESGDEFDEMAALLNAEMHYTDDDSDEGKNMDTTD